MKFTKIVIVRMRYGADKVYLETDLPEATYPYKQKLQMCFSAARESAEEYCKTHFPGVPVEVV